MVPLDTHITDLTLSPFGTRTTGHTGTTGTTGHTGTMRTPVDHALNQSLPRDTRITDLTLSPLGTLAACLDFMQGQPSATLATL